MDDESHLRRCRTLEILRPLQTLEPKDLSREELKGAARVAFQRCRRKPAAGEASPIRTRRSHDPVVFAQSGFRVLQPAERLASANVQRRRRQTKIDDRL